MDTNIDLEIEGEDKPDPEGNGAALEVNREENQEALGLHLLPANLFNLVCMFLNAQELVGLMCTSKKIKEKVESQAQLAVSSIALRVLFKSELENYVEYGEEESYLRCKTTRERIIAERMKEGRQADLRKQSQLRGIIDKNESIRELKSVFSLVSNPSMPDMKIRRDNAGMYAHSWFQNKLVDIYQESFQSKQTNQFWLDKEFDHGLECQGSSNMDLKPNHESQELLFQLYDQQQRDAIEGQHSLACPLLPEGYFSQLKPLSYRTVKEQKYLTYLRQTTLDKKREPHPVRQFLDAVRWYQCFDEMEAISGQSEANSLRYEEESQCVFSQSSQNREEQSNSHCSSNLSCNNYDFNDSQIQNLNFSRHPSVQRFISENPTILVVLLVSAIFKNQCSAIRKYLECNADSASFFDLISEYNLKWNTYTAALIEVNEHLEDVFDSFNELYAAEEGVSMQPKYSLLRVASHHWFHIVFSPLKNRLFHAFFNILTSRRLENLSEIMSNQEQRADEHLFDLHYYPDTLLNIPSEISLRFLRSPFSIGKQTSCNYLHENDSRSMQHEFFNSNSYHADNMLSGFCESMMDLSVNEISVHWLGHSEIQIGAPYYDLNNSFLSNTAKYLDDLQSSIFSGFAMQQLNNNFSLFSQKQELFSTKDQSILNCFDFSSQWRQVLKNELAYCKKIMKESTYKMTSQLMIDSFFKSFKEEVEEKFGNKYSKDIGIVGSQENQKLYEDLSLKGLSEETISKVLNNINSKRLLESFMAMKDEEDENRIKSMRDEDIEDINCYRRIQKDLQEDQFAFYDVTGQVNQDQLDRLKQASHLQKQDNVDLNLHSTRHLILNHDASNQSRW